jgi:hypothetical protein
VNSTTCEPRSLAKTILVIALTIAAILAAAIAFLYRLL